MDAVVVASQKLVERGAITCLRGSDEFGVVGARESDRRGIDAAEASRRRRRSEGSRYCPVRAVIGN